MTVGANQREILNSSPVPRLKVRDGASVVGFDEPLTQIPVSPNEAETTDFTSHEQVSLLPESFCITDNSRVSFPCKMQSPLFRALGK